jgi:hypothetical protein
MFQAHETMTTMPSDRLPPEERPSFVKNPLRITSREVPAEVGSKLRIAAGWNGNVESFWFIVRWTEDIGEDIKADDVYHEGGYPWNHITDIGSLAEHLASEIDWSHPALPAVFYTLMGDQAMDMATAAYYEAPHRNERVMDLIAKTLDKDFTPVVPADQIKPRIRGQYWIGE